MKITINAIEEEMRNAAKDSKVRGKILKDESVLEHAKGAISNKRLNMNNLAHEGSFK